VVFKKSQKRKEEDKDKVKDTLNKNKTFTKVYSKELVNFVNSAVSAEDLDIYKELYKSVAEANNLSKPQDLMMLDMAIFDYLRIKKVQKVLMEEGITISVMSRSGVSFTKTHEANYLLNSIETQFRNLMKEIGITGKEQYKQKMGAETKDFSTFLSANIIDAEVVDDEISGNTNTELKEDSEKGIKGKE